jgi:hypothetical protein
MCRAGAAALVAAGAALGGAPSAAAAEDETPVVSLDPPDAQVFLVPTENFADLAAAPTPTGGDGAWPGLAEAAALAPPEIAETFGAESVTVASHSGEGEIDVQHGGTVVVRLPALVDASGVEVSLEVYADSEEIGDSRVYSTDPAVGEPLGVVDHGGNELEVTLPADDGTYGPAAFLTFDGLTGTDPAITEVYPLGYFLGFTGDATATVTLEPTAGLFTVASCPVSDAASCPGPDVTVGESFDLVVPPSSLLRTLDFGDLDTAEVALLRDDENWESVEGYSSYDDPDLLTRRDGGSASVNLPADMSVGTYLGAVVEGDPFGAGGYALTSFEVEVEVEAAVEAEADVPAIPLNPGLHSDTGWVEDVREASAGSTKVVAGTAMLVVAGLITLVAAAPRRRPPAEG